jgi:hypothetical protein
MSGRWLVLGALVFVTVSAGAASGERLTMRVTPQISRAPTIVVVQTRVEPNEDNRSIEVLAQSEDYYRSSEVPLDGDQSPRSARFEFRDLPGGQYTVAAMLRDSRGVVALKHEEILVLDSLFDR